MSKELDKIIATIPGSRHGPHYNIIKALLIMAERIDRLDGAVFKPLTPPETGTLKDKR